MHHALAALIIQAAGAIELDPDRVSFTATLRLVRRSVVGPADIPPKNRSQGVQTATHLFDSSLRPVQTQDPTPQGGQLLTNTVCDTHGWVVKKNNSWWEPTTTPNGRPPPRSTAAPAPR